MSENTKDLNEKLTEDQKAKEEEKKATEGAGMVAAEDEEMDKVAGGKIIF